MITLFLTRHGRTNFNEQGITSGWDESILTEEGKSQAVRVGTELLKNPPQTIFCSTLQRAIDTAGIIQKICGGGIEKRDDLKEKNLGVLQGMPETEYQLYMNSVSGDVNAYRPQNGESRNDVILRVTRVLTEIQSTCQEKTILIVGHHSTNRSILSVCLGGDPTAYTQRNCTLSLLHYEGSQWAAVYIDKTL